MDVNAEINDLRRRVGDLEGAVNVLSGQLGRLHPELLVVKQQSSDGFDRMNVTMERVIARLDNVNTQVWSLRDDLPSLLRDMLPRSDRSSYDGT
jgi:hypothetical protein